MWRIENHTRSIVSLNDNILVSHTSDEQLGESEYVRTRNVVLKLSDIDVCQLYVDVGYNLRVTANTAHMSLP